MRPQTAMAAVFLVMLATSGLLLRGKSARTPASAEVIVTERGAPAPAPSITAMSFGSEPRPPAAAHRVAMLAETRPTGSGGAGNEWSARPVATKGATSAGARDEDSAPSLRTPAPGMQLADSTDRVSAGGAAARGYDAAGGDPASTFDAALSAYRAGRFDEATRAFDALAPLDGNAELWAARSAREANGCLGALARFDGLAQSARNTPPGWDALLEGALCHRALGDFSKARVQLSALLGVDSHKDRATAELDRLDQMQQARSDEPPRRGKGGTKSAPASPTASPTDASR